MKETEQIGIFSLSPSHTMFEVGQKLRVVTKLKPQEEILIHPSIHPSKRAQDYFAEKLMF